MPCHTRRRLGLLCLCQLLFTTSFSIDLTLTGLVGYQLAANKTLATLPYALITLTACLATFFASLLMGRMGRRGGFMLGSCAGVTGGLISFHAVTNGNFLLFCCGTASVGIFQAFAQYYRLAAADDARTDSERTRNIGFVLSGGVIASLAGPPLAYVSNDLFPATPHAGAYLTVAFLAGLSALMILGFGRDCPAPAHPSGRQGFHVLPHLRKGTRRLYGLAVATSSLACSVMMILMSITPIHLLQQGHDVGRVSAVMMAHLFAMFASSPVSGWFCNRFDWRGSINAGGLLIAGITILNMMSGGFHALCLSLFLLGLAWNLLFVTSSTLLAHTVPEPEKRPAAQGLSELITALCTAIGCFLGGVGLNHAGWVAVNGSTLLVVSLFLPLAHLVSRTPEGLAGAER